jgi:hypothetical protein
MPANHFIEDVIVPRDRDFHTRRHFFPPLRAAFDVRE